MNLNELHRITSSLGDTPPMPLLFLGHGNPMNAITDNEFSRGWREAAKMLPKPGAVLCISAHWETRGTMVTAMEKPQTIHDFGGFPRELYEVQYPAPGSPELAEETRKRIGSTEVGFNYDWGLDHGCWSVMRHLFPGAGVPIVQLSLDRTKPPRWHYELGRELAPLRRKGVLIAGSGNMVHNLGMIDWETKGGFDWALEANEQLKNLITSNETDMLVNYRSLSREVQMSVPTPEHYLPLLYALGMKDDQDAISFFNDRTELGSVSMTSCRFG